MQAEVDTVAVSARSRSALRHLWMHFTQLDSFRSKPVPVFDRAEGCYVFDETGRRYLDASSGLVCVNVGHGRREIADAMARQVAALDYWPVWSAGTPPAIDLAEKIAELAPGDLNRVFFTSTGSESVESAWKLARQYHLLRGHPRKTKIVARQGAYHGTTLGALSVTGIPALQEQFKPLVPEVLHAPRVDPFHAEVSPLQHSLECASAVAALIEGADPDTVAAVVIEPVQNSGGSLVAEPEYFAELRRICDRHDVLLVSDETICAWGRIGSFFGAQRLGYQPDIITTAKGLTSGYIPMGAVIASDRIAEPFLRPGVSFNHGHTYGGHPVAAAAALANLAILEEEALCRRSETMGARLRRGLQGLADIPIVGDIRGLGLFQTVELVADQGARTAFSAQQTQLLTARIPAMLRDRGVLFRAMHRGAPLLQLAPPLIAGDREIDELVAVIGEVLTEVTRAL